MILGFEPLIFGAICLIFFSGGLIKGILGFGLPLITMSLLPFVVSIETSIALSALVQPATNIGQLLQSGGMRKALGDTWPVLIMLVPGTALGAWYLTALDTNSIMMFVGIMVALFAIYNLSGFKFILANALRRKVGVLTGFIAGIVGGLTSINGVFFIMYLVAIEQDRQSFRSSIALLFLVSGALISSGLWAVGFLTYEVFLTAMLALGPAFAGMFVGNKIGKNISNDLFRTVVLYGLLVIAAVFVVRSTTGI